MDSHLVENVICNLYEQFMDGRNVTANKPTLTLPTPEGKDEHWYHSLVGEFGIVIPVEITCDNHGYDKKGKLHKNWEPVSSRYYMTFIILSSRKVFLNVSSTYNLSLPNPESFSNESNHDSCWRSDGLQGVHKTFMKAYEDCWGHIDNKLRPAPIEANFFTSFNKVKFVRVEHEPIDRNDTYWHKLTKIEEVKYNLTLSLDKPVAV